MSSPQTFLKRAGVPPTDAANVEALLAPTGEDLLLLFAGDPAQRVEAMDVAVIFPELLKAFRGRLRGAVVAAGAEKSSGRDFTSTFCRASQ